MYDLGPAETGSLCKSAASGKPETRWARPRDPWGSGSLGAHRHRGGRRFFCGLFLRSSMTAAVPGSSLRTIGR